MVSIIIVNLNGKSFLEGCLKSLMEISYTDFEVILVDNNSTDNSIEFVKKTYPSVIILKLDKNYGFARPNNLGAKNARGDLLLFLNNDTTVTKDFVTEMVNVLIQDKEIAICQSNLLDPDGNVDSSGDFIDTLGITYSSKEQVSEVRDILSAKGASMMIRKGVFEELRGFDEKFFLSFEDIDLGWRAWILGYKVALVPKSIVYHIGGQTIQKMRKEVSFHGFKNQLSMKITNFESNLAIKTLISFFIIYGFRMLRVLFDYKITGSTKIKATKYEDKIAEKPSIRTIFKSIFWICTNSRYLWKKHKLVNSSRVFSTNDLQKKNVIIS